MKNKTKSTTCHLPTLHKCKKYKLLHTALTKTLIIKPIHKLAASCQKEHLCIQPG